MLTKKDYPKFIRAISYARKKRIRGWYPSSLSDNTRKIHNQNLGYKSLNDWIRAVKNGIACDLDKHIGQKNSVVICFEAAAMHSQFTKYTRDYFVPLIPFRGDASIPLKDSIAKLITDLSRKGKPIIVLYYGDYDRKGIQIPISAFSDIRSWTHAEFDFIRVGLNPDHIGLYNIIENPMKPGEYQWEALDDNAAHHLITGTLDQYIDLDKIEKIKKIEKYAESHLRTFLKEWDPLELLKDVSDLA
jgi:hypothetical protein